VSDTLEEEFHSVRQAFFPQWNEGGQWRICAASSLTSPKTNEGASGLCDHDSKTIRVREDIKGRELTVTMIHEIGHAVLGDPAHGNAWRAEMHRVAELASSRGQTDLAEDVKEDAFMRSDDPRPSRDAIVEYKARRRVRERPTATVRQISDCVADNIEMKRGEFWGRYANTIRRATGQEKRRLRGWRAQEER
jgi:hypothetical protein